MTVEQTIEQFKLALNSNAYLNMCECSDMKNAISALEKQIPKKPYTDNENGEYEKDYCPTCHSSLFPNDHHCRCGQKIDWSDAE